MADKIQKEGMLKVGTLLANGKYRIDQYLASGGFGNTYVATDLAFDEKVAIKELFIKGVCGRTADASEISISLSENQRTFKAQQEKFRKEARRIRKLNNPHIITVHDLFDENGTSYYVMDFVEGESLSARLKRTSNPMSESELMLLLPQILDALECIHNEGIWHLDLKPANIMLDAKGNVRLIDFGASKQLRNANGVSLSTSSSLSYTAGYASSEQMEKNIDKFGPWTDLYALGATMYNLLTLQQPPSPSDIDEDSRAALKLPHGISKKTEKLIFWLMKPNRKMRPQKASDVKQVLMETQDVPQSPSSPQPDDDSTVIISPEPTPSSPSAPKMARKRNVAGIFISIAVIAVIIVATILTLQSAFNSENAGAAADTTVADTFAVIHVTDHPVTVSAGPSNMRQYAYTGELVDTLGALPNGMGIAKFKGDDKNPAATYKGNFVDGVCQDQTGEATMTFENGDKYVGTFTEGYWDEGKYISSNGSYFAGTFQNGIPYNGSWCNAQGVVESKVVNGVEQ